MLFEEKLRAVPLLKAVTSGPETLSGYGYDSKFKHYFFRNDTTLAITKEHIIERMVNDLRSDTSGDENLVSKCYFHLLTMSPTAGGMANKKMHTSFIHRRLHDHNQDKVGLHLVNRFSPVL